MTDDLRQRLHKAIQEAISRKDKAFTGGDIAASLKRRDADLWDEVREVLATEKLVAIVNGVMRGPLHQANSAQMDLGLEGFEDVPKFIRAGRAWVQIQDANADQLDGFCSWWKLRVDRGSERSKRDRQILADVMRLAHVVRRYDAQKPGITLGTVLEIRAVRAELRAVKIRS